MATITDFEEWLNEADPDSCEEIYALYKAVSDIDQHGMYECSMNNGRYFVKGDHTTNTLMLASGKAYSAFLNTINSRFQIEGDIEGWYGFSLAMAKSD